MEPKDVDLIIPSHVPLAALIKVHIFTTTEQDFFSIKDKPNNKNHRFSSEYCCKSRVLKFHDNIPGGLHLAAS